MYYYCAESEGGYVRNNKPPDHTVIKETKDLRVICEIFQGHNKCIRNETKHVTKQEVYTGKSHKDGMTFNEIETPRTYYNAICMHLKQI